MRKINEIIIHCSATPEGRNVTIDEIDKWHKAKGWNCIGYHYVIYLDGTIKQGRAMNITGAHCIGHNTNSIGICYIGGMSKDGKTPKDTRTDAQKLSLIKLIKELKVQFPNATVHGHNEYANKACPCFNANKEYCNITA